MSRATTVIGVLAVLLVSVTPSAAEGVWVLWVEAPVGSDQWSIADIPSPRFATREACEQRARELNDLERSIAALQRATGAALDQFNCLPDTVDPRP